MSITVYKLTTQDNKTRKGHSNECTWGPGVTHSGTGRGGLCSNGYIHAYLSPALALLLNPIHANIHNPKLWECSVSRIALSDNDLKVGSVSLTTVKEVSLPKISNEQRVIFALLCAKKAQDIAKPCTIGNQWWQITYQQKMSEFNAWANTYISGSNRKDRAASVRAARAADAASAAADAADAADAARAAAYAAAYAARDAAAAASADAADAAAVASARAAAYAARDAAACADAAAVASARAAADVKIDFVELADRAINHA